jgi:hypothetical protein
MGILEIIFVVLLILKLTGLASISWLTVWSPLITATVLYVVLFGLLGYTNTKAKSKFPRRFK